MDVDDALEQCDRIIELIDNDLPAKAWDRAASFFEDIRAKAASVAETIRTRGCVTDKQQAALDGWEAGVRKWIRD